MSAVKGACGGEVVRVMQHGGEVCAVQLVQCSQHDLSQPSFTKLLNGVF